jgi:hypothetical protein
MMLFTLFRGASLSADRSHMTVGVTWAVRRQGIEVEQATVRIGIAIVRVGQAIVRIRRRRARCGLVDAGADDLGNGSWVTFRSRYPVAL